MINGQQFVLAFRESAPYINVYKDETFVILLSHESLASNGIRAIVHDIALLNSLGIQIVLAVESLPTPYQRPVPTDNDKLDAIKAQSGLHRSLLEALFSSTLPNTPMYGSNIHILSGNFITAKPLGVLDGQDYHFTGAVRRVNHKSLSALLENNQIIMLPDLAYSSTGECFHVSYENIGIAAAETLKASKLLIYTNQCDFDQLPKEMTPTLAADYYKKHPINVLNLAIKACNQGIERTHIINFENDGGLLTELFTRDGTGALLSRTPFESIHPASIDDVGGIMALLQPLEEEGVLVKRDPELLEQEINHFVVIKRESMIIATAALYPFDDKSAELACVVTHADYRGQSRAHEILLYIERQAKNQGIHSLFVLTTQSEHFFIDNGFELSSIEHLPTEKKSLYNFQRKSKIFKKDI